MKWDIDKTEGVLWIAIEASKSIIKSMEKELGIRFNTAMVYCNGHNFEWCTLEEENEKIGFFLIKRFKDKKFMKKFVRDYNKFYKNTIKELNKLDSINFSRLTKDKIFQMFKNTNNLYIKNFDWGYIIEPMDFVMPQLINSLLIKHGFSQQEIVDLMAIADITFLNKEKQELIRIAKKINGQVGLLKKHAYKYRWLQSAHAGRKDIPFSYFINQLNELKNKDLNKELRKLKNFEYNVKSRKKRILKKKKKDNEIKTLFSIAEMVAPFHDKRKELFLRTVYTLDTLRGEIAKRYGYKKEDLSAFSADELLKLKFGKKIDKNYAKSLAKESLFYADTNKNIWKIYCGKEARNIFKKEMNLNINNTNELIGMGASLGKAEGKVKIVYGFKDLNKIKKGDILVASMTRPEHVSTMKKVAAIVTDEGGITCHAAIVSRELGIPCVIGTKIATKVLKDGDLVEVDANKGIVRKIEKVKKE